MRQRTQRRLRGEQLESRIPLAADAALIFGDWHNESNSSDVNGDGYVAPLDALGIINAINRFSAGTIDEVQQAWHQVDPDASQLSGGFLPDADRDGNVSSSDVLTVVNRLNFEHAAGSQGEVRVIPDPQGRPSTVVFSSEDGRTKEVDVSQDDLGVSWDGLNVYLNQSDGTVEVIAKPGIGILERIVVPGDGAAIVTRLSSDGSEVVERYVCVPGIIIDDGGNLTITEPDDVRRPIAGFEEMVGAILTRETTLSDGSTVMQQYEEATVERLLSISARLSSGASVTVDMTSVDPSAVTPDMLDTTSDDLLFLLRHGYEASEPLTLESLADAVTAIADAA